MSTPDNWAPKLVALDIDGTLVDHNGALPGPVFEAVRKVIDAGVPVVLATGRSWNGTDIVFEQLQLPEGYAVSSNGAVVVHYPPIEIVSQRTFDPAAVIDLVSAAAPNALIAAEVIGRGYRVSGDFPEGDLSGEMIPASVAELRGEPVTRVIIRDPEASDSDFIDLAERLGLHGVSYFIGYSAWLDIAPEGVDKASGLQQVCDRLGVQAADVLALGDGRNDIEMLTWAGRGVALGDAPPEVKSVADAVTGRFVDGGTVDELSRWF
ncbi:HAD family hydrolase [Naumannella halotolerans]|uniref:HAD superfamily hydrolase (TIGR01484 family) n=1 Tax=Naumannella halotolerans TaxID=993414 RepID=A0A4R7IWQ8_9ACTN|nr:HAD family hydrolase [Naumannella halotolerans]TDT29101.1 HAD superfamily hydrolase (TIGR01484 family) [Naumannella halotolerans]